MSSAVTRHFVQRGYIIISVAYLDFSHSIILKLTFLFHLLLLMPENITSKRVVRTGLEAEILFPYMVCSL